MTIAGLITKNAFRNKRRSLSTIFSIAFSLLLLTLMMTIWRIYLDPPGAQSAKRLLTRHRVSLANFLPSSYRERIRTIKGVASLVPMTWFGGIYMDDRPENLFAQFSTDPTEITKVYPENRVPEDQLRAWERDRTGCMANAKLAAKHGWKLGDRISLRGTIFPFNPEFTLRAIYTPPTPSDTLFFNTQYLEESVSWAKGQSGFFTILTDSPQSVPDVSTAVDEMFHNSLYPTKTETERAFQLDSIATLGNVKAFILGICGAVVFTTLLVNANTMAMSVRERTREVAVLKALGFTRAKVLGLFVTEGVVLALLGGLLGGLAVVLLVRSIAGAPQMAGFFNGLIVTYPTVAVLSWPRSCSDFFARWCLPTQRRKWISCRAFDTSDNSPPGPSNKHVGPDSWARRPSMARSQIDREFRRTGRREPVFDSVTFFYFQ
jgi:putative ABC transport system permease protein